MKAWESFKGSKWKKNIDVANFISTNFREYKGNEDFLASATSGTISVWETCNDLFRKELKTNTIEVELKQFSSIAGLKPGYINKHDNLIVGLQSDKPLKRLVNPYGGMRMVKKSLDAYNLKLDPVLEKDFNEYRKTHSDGVFDAYTKQIRAARKAGLITGLPDSYGRGRIIGDYRRVALYGIDFLVEEKLKDLDNIIVDGTEENIRLREETNEQIRALAEIKEMAKSYGFDISEPAETAKEAVQWLYFGYLAAVKENNGAAMSLGRTSTFLDIYIERDIKNGILSEIEAQELIDRFIIKLRLVRHLRTPEYDDIFAGDPTWVTESIGGMLNDKKSLVTKTSFRYLHTLKNLGSSPEPNLTVLWSEHLPKNFKRYAAKISIETDALQYENDDIMRPIYGSDYAIACCVSAMKLGKQMQYFGARCNIAKALLYAINGGVDEVLGIKVLDGIPPITSEYLDYNEVKKSFFKVLRQVADIYVDAMNIIHHMHDKYAYERGQMALHDTHVERLMAFGIAGLSVVTDSLSAIKYAKVRVNRDKNGIATGFHTDGEFPCYGNNDDRVDKIAVNVVKKFVSELKRQKLHRNAKHTLSALTITSNVMYGKKTGSTPDGRYYGEPFAPGANPMHGRDKKGALASLSSVAKIPYCDYCEDGVSNTFTIVPNSLGKDKETQKSNLVNILDGYFKQRAHHLNVNVLNRALLIDAMKNPTKYPTLTIRVSGYAVNFNKLSDSHKREVIQRTFHNNI